MDYAEALEGRYWVTDSTGRRLSIGRCKNGKDDQGN
jgi:hypothetical protein